MIPEPIHQNEKVLLQKLFRSPALKKGSQKIASPMSPIVFCYDRSEGFVGNDVEGISGKLCNDFFPTPTDEGICLTKNFAMKEVVLQNEAYEYLFESSQRQSKTKLKGNTLWSEMKLLIFADADNDFRQSIERSKNSNLSEIEFQIHSADEFASMILDNEYDINLALASNACERK